jgi:hypothetical protein
MRRCLAVAFLVAAACFGPATCAAVALTVAFVLVVSVVFMVVVPSLCGVMPRLFGADAIDTKFPASI